MSCIYIIRKLNKLHGYTFYTKNYKHSLKNGHLTVHVLSGKTDAINLDWTPKGSKKDVKKYLEELPEDLLPIAGSEAAKLRKQRLQRQTPAHDIDASLCHALTPEEIQQLEDYVAHIRKHSVGQGKIIQMPIFHSNKHNIGDANSKFLHEYTPEQLTSSQALPYQPADLANNLHNLSLHSDVDKNLARNRAAFLHSQLPSESVLSTIDEQNQENIQYLSKQPKVTPNYAPQNFHRTVDSRNPILQKNPQDIRYDLHKNVQENSTENIPMSNPINANVTSNLLGNISDAILSEQFLSKHPDYASNFPQNDNTKNLLNKATENAMPGQLNADLLNNRRNPIMSEDFLREHPEFASDAEHNHSIPSNVHTDKVNNPNTQLAYSLQNETVPKHLTGRLIGNKMRDFSYDRNTNKELVNNMPVKGRIDTINNQYYHPASENINKKLGVGERDKASFPLENTQNVNDTLAHKVTYSTNNVPFNKYPNAVPNDQYAQNYPISESGNLSNQSVPLPLTTSNVERHQEQFKNNYPELESFSNSAFKSRVPIPVFNAENKIHPIESDQNMQSVGYIRDIDYNIPKIPTNVDVVNSNSISTCHSCKKNFDDGAIAVSVDRTSSLWHASCFNCRTCKQPLADLLYFYHKETDDIYCGRDYALLRGIPRCGACDELIFVREYCLAEERTYHIKHFCCFECDEPLAGKQYVMENNQPNCIDCYEKLKAEKCTDCGYVIAPDEQGVSLQELHWHANNQCFVCKYCRKPLLGNKMLLRNKNLFCSDVCFKTYFA